MTEDTEYMPTSHKNFIENGRYAGKSTLEDKIKMLAEIFPFALGDRVRNRHQENGFIEMVGLDERGVQYLVRYADNNRVWELDAHISKQKFGQENETVHVKESIGLKTDIPDPKTEVS